MLKLSRKTAVGRERARAHARCSPNVNHTQRSVRGASQKHAALCDVGDHVHGCCVGDREICRGSGTCGAGGSSASDGGEGKCQKDARGYAKIGHRADMGFANQGETMFCLLSAPSFASACHHRHDQEARNNGQRRRRRRRAAAVRAVECGNRKRVPKWKRAADSY